MPWTQDGRDRFERHDGAVVKRSTDEYYAQPWLDGHRGWIAFAPDPSSSYLRNDERPCRMAEALEDGRGSDARC